MTPRGRSSSPRSNTNASRREVGDVAPSGTRRVRVGGRRASAEREARSVGRRIRRRLAMGRCSRSPRVERQGLDGAAIARRSRRAALLHRCRSAHDQRRRRSVRPRVHRRRCAAEADHAAVQRRHLGASGVLGRREGDSIRQRGHAQQAAYRRSCRRQVSGCGWRCPRLPSVFRPERRSTVSPSRRPAGRSIGTKRASSLRTRRDSLLAKALADLGSGRRSGRREASGRHSRDDRCRRKGPHGRSAQRTARLLPAERQRTAQGPTRGVRSRRRRHSPAISRRSKAKSPARS